MRSILWNAALIVGCLSAGLWMIGCACCSNVKIHETYQYREVEVPVGALDYYLKQGPEEGWEIVGISLLASQGNNDESRSKYLLLLKRVNGDGSSKQ